MSERAVLDGVISTGVCRELVSLATSLAVIGYRTAVCSATIFEIARQCPPLLIPLVAAREAVRAAVEEALGMFLLVEFTGLISWRPGSSIGWHYDANRPYLRQRSHAAVCYLNTAEIDFQGGTFRFQSGQPDVVHASPGRVVAYSAQDVHSVDPITAGERFTLTLWFTEEPEHCEDTRLLAQLSGPVPRTIGLPASMWRLPDATDLRLCRLALAGFALIHEHQVLHSLCNGLEADDPVPSHLQLAVQPGVLRAWLKWQRAAGISSSCTPNHAAVLPSLSSAAIILPGVQFENVQQAVLDVHSFLEQQAFKDSREQVCCLHLCEAAAEGSTAPNCAWLRSCQLQHWSDDNEALPFTVAEVQQAVATGRSRVHNLQAALESLQPQWLQNGALYCQTEVHVCNKRAC